MKILRFLLIGLVFIGLLSCQKGESKVKISTEYGDMIFKLYDFTPKHKENFLKLVQEGFYDDLLFHRVINGFMIQGGDPDSKNATATANLGSGGPGYLIDAEIGAPHFKGTLAAARTGAGNPEMKSSGSQFYIVQGRPQDAQTLNAVETRGKFKYNPAQVKKYEEIGGTPMLDNQYTVFGEIISGMEVIDKIAAIQTGAADRPLADVKMKITIY
jgi:peptidyl-prolyl cis-trans isomerase B (cyclophilin B)